MKNLLVVIHYTGPLLIILGCILFLPFLVAFLFKEEGYVLAYMGPAILSVLLGVVFYYISPAGDNTIVVSMLVCVLGWIFLSVLGALPFIFLMGESLLNSVFEAISGFTTTGMTIFLAVEDLPPSLLFWRALMQWLGGLGILTFFLAVTFRGRGGLWHLYAAESHKSSMQRPVPNIFRTVEILWLIYSILTILTFVSLFMLQLSPFSALIHALTTVSTGGFSIYSQNIGYYAEVGHPFFRQIQYALIIFMLLGGVNFLFYYKLVTGGWRDLFQRVEMKYYWGLLLGGALLVFLNMALSSWPQAPLEEIFRQSLFHVSSLLSSTCFTTKDIFSPFFPPFARIFFLFLLFTGGSIGSTASGFKVLRVVILKKTLVRELKRIYYPRRAQTPVVIDGEILSQEEIMRTVSIFVGWILLILFGGAITSFISHLEPFTSLSTMISIVSNMGPIELSVGDLRDLNPLVKVIYMVGMLAGRLEIVPLFLFFFPEVWGRFKN